MVNEDITTEEVQIVNRSDGDETDNDVKESCDKPVEKEESESDSEENFTLKENSTVYVVCVDNVPKYYVKSLEQAREKMWNAARRLRWLYDDYTGYIGEPSHNPDEIHVVGRHKFFVVSYDRVLYHLKITRVSELDCESSKTE